VLFVFESPGAWTRYRCDHQAEQLAVGGLSCDVVQADTLELATAIEHYDVFVLYRVPWTDAVGEFLSRAHARERPVVFDTDDLVFEPAFTPYLAFLSTWSEDDRRGQAERFDGYRRTLEACGRATVSTEPLAEFARRHAENVTVAFNRVSKEMVRRANAALAARPRRRAGLTIAYLSGTRTHDRDFLEAADAVLWALESHPDARFLAVGKLELDERFAERAPQVERMSLQPWESLPAVLAGIDINLAPLEPDNPITACKSCAKYLEAGLLGVPTIASPRPDFCRVIEHGRNGLLAEGVGEWKDALRRLIETADERREVGANALADVRTHHTTSVRAASLVAALGLTPSAHE
jgi:glycosyltransferase involved in cell wall biosynthesis